jgi:hypothetical protein
MVSSKLVMIFILLIIKKDFKFSQLSQMFIKFENYFLFLFLPFWWSPHSWSWRWSGEPNTACASGCRPQTRNDETSNCFRTCKNIHETLTKKNENIGETLMRHCRNITETLPKHSLNNSKTKASCYYKTSTKH